MVTVWKVLFGLALVVPMGAYVVGSLAASAADDPAPRQTIEIREPSPSQAPTHTPTSRPSPTKTATADDVEVITPNYDDFDDFDDTGDDDGDDHHGKGGDDRQDEYPGNKGHGGGDD